MLCNVAIWDETRFYPAILGRDFRYSSKIGSSDQNKNFALRPGSDAICAPRRFDAPRVNKCDDHPAGGPDGFQDH